MKTHPLSLRDKLLVCALLLWSSSMLVSAVGWITPGLTSEAVGPINVNVTVNRLLGGTTYPLEFDNPTFDYQMYCGDNVDSIALVNDMGYTLVEHPSSLIVEMPGSNITITANSPDIIQSSDKSTVTYPNKFSNYSLTYHYGLYTFKELLNVSTPPPAIPAEVRNQSKIIYVSRLAAFKTNYPIEHLLVSVNDQSVSMPYSGTPSDKVTLVTTNGTVVWHLNNPFVYDSSETSSLLPLNYTITTDGYYITFTFEIPYDWIYGATYPAYLDPSWTRPTTVLGCSEDGDMGGGPCVNSIDGDNNTKWDERGITKTNDQHDWTIAGTGWNWGIRYDLGAVYDSDLLSYSAATYGNCPSGQVCIVTALQLCMNSDCSDQGSNFISSCPGACGQNCWANCTFSRSKGRYLQFGGGTLNGACGHPTCDAIDGYDVPLMGMYEVRFWGQTVQTQLRLPVNGNITSNNAPTFQANMTAYATANMTLKVWGITNSSIYLTNTSSCSTGVCTRDLSVVLPQAGSYYWNMLGCSDTGNCVTDPANRTITLLYDIGHTCSNGAQCQSGNCISGYCCTTPSCSACQSCGVAGHQGSCYFIPPGGTDPLGTCNTNNCGNGTCDGAGSCGWYTSGERNCYACKTCNGASSTACVSLPAASQDNVGSYVCNGICKECDGSGNCINQNHQDLFNQCGTSGCGNDLCDGSSTCFQEFSNQSNSCGGLSGGAYSEMSAWNDGNWSTSGTIASTVYWNYTRPASADSTSTLLLGTSNGGVYPPEANITLSIPSGCWSQQPLQFKYVTGPDPPYMCTWYNYTCYDGSQWENLSIGHSCGVGGSWSFTEEGMNWAFSPTGSCDHYVNGERACGACQTCDNATSNSCVNLQDNTQDTEGVSTCVGLCQKCFSGSCTNENSAEDLFNQCGSVPCGNDTIPSYYYGWSNGTCYYMDSFPNSVCNGTGNCWGSDHYCPSSTQGVASSITCGCPEAGIIGCTGTAPGSCDNSQCWSPPSAMDVQIIPAPAFITDDLTCTYTFYDNWSHTENTSARQVEWFKNESAIPTLNGLMTISSGNLSAGDAWICSVSVANDHNQSGFFNSSEVYIGDDIPPYNTTIPTISSLSECSENGSTIVSINITDDSSDIGLALLEVSTPTDIINFTMSCTPGKPTQCTKNLTGYSTSYTTNGIYFSDTSNNWAYVFFNNTVDVQSCHVYYGGGGGGGPVAITYFLVYPRQTTTKGDQPTPAFIVGDKSLKYTIVPKLAGPTTINVFVQPATFKDNANNIINSTGFFKTDPQGSIKMGTGNITLVIYCDIPQKYKFQPFGLFNTSIIIKKEGVDYQQSIAVTCESQEHFDGAGSISTILNQPVEFLAGATVGEIWFIAIALVVVISYRASMKKKPRQNTR